MERIVRLVDEPELATELQSQSAEDALDGCLLVRGEEHRRAGW